MMWRTIALLALLVGLSGCNSCTRDAKTGKGAAGNKDGTTMPSMSRRDSIEAGLINPQALPTPPKSGDACECGKQATGKNGETLICQNNPIKKGCHWMVVQREGEPAVVTPKTTTTTTTPQQQPRLPAPSGPRIADLSATAYGVQVASFGAPDGPKKYISAKWCTECIPMYNTSTGMHVVVWVRDGRTFLYAKEAETHYMDRRRSDKVFAARMPPFGGKGAFTVEISGVTRDVKYVR